MSDETYTKIDFWSIEKGDSLKVDRTFRDGTACSLTGVAVRKSHDSGNWMTEEGLAIALAPENRRYAEQTKIYRKVQTQEEKDAAFEFPKSVGSKIKVFHKQSQRDQLYIYTGAVWVELLSHMPLRYLESNLRLVSSNYRIWP